MTKTPARRVVDHCDGRPKMRPHLQIFRLQIDGCFDAEAVEVEVQPLVGAFAA
jgi:hypothetical protein